MTEVPDQEPTQCVCGGELAGNGDCSASEIPAPTQCFCGGGLTADGHCSVSETPHADCPRAEALMAKLVGEMKARGQDPENDPPWVVYT